MKNMFGNVYNFSPKTFLLPNEYKKFIETFTREDYTESNRPIWIVKANDLSRGRGISIINDISDLQYDQASVIQRYITNPLLIRGTKWDMRIYVLITQMRPMKVYVYKEGIC